MSEYDFQIRHLSGDRNVIADYLSRSIGTPQCAADVFDDSIERLVVGGNWESDGNVMAVWEADKEQRNENSYEPSLPEVFNFLGSLDSTQTTLRVRIRSKQYPLVGSQLMRRTEKGLRVVLPESKEKPNSCCFP